MGTEIIGWLITLLLFCILLLIWRILGIEGIGGLIIGFVANDWLDRTLLPFAFGIIGCVDLFFVLRKDPLAFRYREAMKQEGMSKSEIEEGVRELKQMSRMAFEGAFGFTGWKLYAWQFIWSSLTALLFSLIAGAIRVFLIDR